MRHLAIELSDDFLDALAATVAQRLAAQVPQPPPVSPYLTVREAAEVIRARPQRIYDLVSAGRLRRHKDGARLLIARSDLDRYLEQGPR